MIVLWTRFTLDGLFAHLILDKNILKQFWSSKQHKTSKAMKKILEIT